MVLWFAAIGALGVARDRRPPGDPEGAVADLRGRASCSATSRSPSSRSRRVVLAVTGAEALYADMGHFGRAPITRIWLLLVFPACILNYMGQGALILGDPAQRRQPVLPARAGWAQAAAGLPGRGRDGHRLAGGDLRGVLGDAAGRPARLPAAAADRAHLGGDDRPDLRAVDQLALLVAVLTLVVTFKTSTALAFAYGMAVTGTITITTLLFFYIARHTGEGRCGSSSPAPLRSSAVDLLFLAANLTKIAARRLAAAAHRDRRVHRDHHLAAGPGTRHQRRGAATRGRSGRSSDELHASRPAAAPGARHRGLPQPRQGRPRRWRCEPTSSTTTSCTSTS